MTHTLFIAWLAERGLWWEAQAAFERKAAEARVVNPTLYPANDTFWFDIAAYSQSCALQAAYQIMSYELRYGS